MVDDKVAAARLSPEQNERIFRETIVRREFPAAFDPNVHPTIIIVGGQPGAGKTSIVLSSLDALSKLGPTLRVIGDDLRAYHPRFKLYQDEDAEMASRLTHRDASIWADKVLIEASQRRLNIVLENTMRSPEGAAFIARQMREAGYRVETRVVAVNERESWQGCLLRYEDMSREGNAARIPPKEHHDHAVAGLTKTLQYLEEGKLIDAVQVRLRNGTIIYDNQLVQGEWEKPAWAADFITQERERTKTQLEIMQHSERWQSVLAKMENRGAGNETIEATRQAALESVGHFRMQARERRDIIDRNPDPLKLYDELYRNAARDASLRPIGNLEAHAEGRLAQSYAALKLIEAARDNGALPEGATIVATGARVQDKQGAREFPAAHRIPADLAVRAVDGSQLRLTEHFGVELNRIVIERAVFAPTDRVSRIANVADSWLEQGGMKNTLVHAANEVASGKMTANEAMTHVVEPGYQGSVNRAAQKIDRNFSYIERTAISRAIVDERGRPLRASAYDLKLRTADLETRAQAKAMMEQTFDVYGNYIVLGPGERKKVDQLVEGIDQNERNLDLSRKPLIPATILPDLTAAEIAARVQASDQVQGRRAEIEHLSRIVYGSSTALSDTVQAIDNNPAVASSSAATIRNAPEQVGELAGTPGGWIRSASPERKSAEAHVPQLAAALEGYGQALSSEQGRVVAAHSADQRRVALEVPAPSPQLSATLRSPLSAQAARFQSRPESRKELERLSVALSRRLAPQDHTALRTGDYAAAQKSLGLSAAQTKQVAQTRQQVLEANRGQIQQREIAQQQHAGPVITR